MSVYKTCNGYLHDVRCYDVCHECKKVIYDHEEHVIVGSLIWHKDCHYESLKTVLSKMLIESLDHDFPSDLQEESAKTLGVYLETFSDN